MPKPKLSDKIKAKSDRLLDQLLNCHKCGIDLTGVPNLTINTEVGSYTFCAKCLRVAFIDLSNRKNKSPEEMLFQADLRKYLNKVKELES